MNETKRPTIGVGVFVIKDHKILMGKRKNALGDGSWALPGGHLEWNETPEQCAQREVMEEAGITIKNMRKGTFTNDVFEQAGKHYVTLFIIADYTSGIPTVCEPDKCEQWEWFSWHELPQPLFLPLQNLLKTDFNPVR